MVTNITRPLALIILDGWGVSTRTDGNAIALAHTPHYDALCQNYPQTRLAASGELVGLAADAPGNAEVGHLTIGAGRIIETNIARISEAVRSGEFLENQVLKGAFGSLDGNAAVHFIGLISDAGIHSSQETLFALLRMAKREGVGEVYVHAILDGRDVEARTADIYVEALEIKMADIGIGCIASLCGRYYAMDSGEHWERTARAYTMLVHGEGERSFDAVSAVRASFLRGISDEFIAPIIIERSMNVPLVTAKDGDLVVFFNHEPAGMRQLVRSLSVADASAAKPRINTVCLTEYDRSFGLPAAFGRRAQQNVLAEVLNRNGVHNYRITETARAAHVSNYFNCGIEQNGEHETHIFLPGADGRLNENEPESRSFKITNSVLRGMESDGRAVFVVNLPASAMMAGRGNLERTVEAVQYVDTCLGGILEKVQEMNGVALVTASHGECESVGIGAVSLNPVPFHYIDHASPGARLSESGSLTDIAPTILGILGIEKPPEMTGSDLRISLR